MADFMVHNWRKWQPKKPDAPGWIRLHLRLLDDFDFSSLPDASKAHAILIWLLAARSGNRMRRDARFIARLIGANEPVDLDALEAAGFIEPWQDCADDGSDGAGSRYIPVDVRRSVETRDKGACVECGSTDGVEFCLIVPASKGGVGSDPTNVRMLCRGCSRPDRAKATPEATQHAALVRSMSSDRAQPSCDSAQTACAEAALVRLDEKRGEERRKEENETRAPEPIATRPDHAPEPKRQVNFDSSHLDAFGKQFGQPTQVQTAGEQYEMIRQLSNKMRPKRPNGKVYKEVTPEERARLKARNMEQLKALQLSEAECITIEAAMERLGFGGDS